MSKARLVITALFVEGQKPSKVAIRYGVHRAWVYKLKARYQAEGDAALEPRSRRPKTTPTATLAATVDLVLRLRKQLTESGLDAGADTIGWHLTHRHQVQLSRATINRILVRAGAVTPDPAKRPKASYIRFEADQPNGTWQSDFTHYRLTNPDGTPGRDTEILTWLDDHSRYALHVSAHLRITASIVLAGFRQAADLHGYPASTLTRQRHGLHRPVRRRPRWPHRPGGRATPAGHRAEELPAQPPHHLRQGGTVPADPQEVAGRPGAAADQRRPAADPARHLRRGVQPAPPAPLPAPSRDPGRGLRRPAPRPPPAPTAPPTPTTGSGTTRSTSPAPSPCASPADCATSASAEPTPEPTSSCSSRTTTSASSTPPPENSSATWSSTPATTTSPPAGRQDQHQSDPNHNSRTHVPWVRLSPMS